MPQLPSGAHLRSRQLFDPAAAGYQIAGVEDRALPGRDGALRLVEADFDAVRLSSG